MCDPLVEFPASPKKATGARRPIAPPDEPKVNVRGLCRGDYCQPECGDGQGSKSGRATLNRPHLFPFSLDGAAGLGAAGRDGNLSMRGGPTTWSNREGTYLQSGCPHPQRLPSIFPFTQASEQ